MRTYVLKPDFDVYIGKINNKFGYDRVRVRVESKGGRYAECWMPECEFDKVYGYSEQELLLIKDYLIRNYVLMKEMARGDF